MRRSPLMIIITNYRPISIMPVISKIFEKCTANIIESYFKFSDNQYGRKIFQFVNGSSTEYITGKRSRISRRYNLCRGSRIRE